MKKMAPPNPFEKHLASKKNANESISKNEMFEKLGIRNPEAEKVADLSVHSMIMTGELPKTKKEVTSNVINKLESEIEKLKYKRDTYIAVSILIKRVLMYLGKGKEEKRRTRKTN